MLLDIVTKMAPDDYVGFTFFIGYMAMAAASVFFFFERGSVDAKYCTDCSLWGSRITSVAAIKTKYAKAVRPIDR